MALQAFLYIDPAGEFTRTKIFGYYTKSDDPNYGKIRIWDLDSFSTPRELGTIGGPWELMLGDLNGDHQIDILGRRAATTHLGREGDLAVWLSGGSHGSPFNEVLDNRGNIDLEWKLQVADMNFDGCADIFGYNANRDLWVWHNITDPNGKRGLFSAGHSYGTFGPDWQHLQIASLRSAPPPSVDILGIANNGEVHGWFTNGTGVAGAGVNLENARGWIPLAGLPQTRFA